VIKHAPNGWKEQYALECQEGEAVIIKTCTVDVFAHKKSKARWARLIAKIYEIDPLICPKCNSEMRVISVITSEYEINKILRHLAKTGKSPPGIHAVA
jgi:hypothetical protein